MKNNLRAIRERRGLTQDEVAKKVGLAPAVLSKLELGHRDMLEDHARKLADFYHVSMDFLFAREFEPPKPKEPDITFSAIIGKLPSFSNLELARLAGTIEGITNERLRIQPAANGNGIAPKAPEAKVTNKNVV